LREATGQTMLAGSVVEIGLSAACVQSQAASRALRRRRTTASTSSARARGGRDHRPSALPGDDPVAGSQIGQRAVARRR
jgi:hypothetical protein